MHLFWKTDYISYKELTAKGSLLPIIMKCPCRYRAPRNRRFQRIHHAAQVWINKQGEFGAKWLWALRSSITDPKSTRKPWICTITTNIDHIIRPNVSKHCCMIIQFHFILIKCLVPWIQTCAQCRWLLNNLRTFDSALLSNHRHHKLGTNTGLPLPGWRKNVGACNCSGICHDHKHKKKKPIIQYPACI